MAWYPTRPTLFSGDSPHSNIFKLKPEKRYEGLNLGPSLYLKPRWLGALHGLQFSTEIHQIQNKPDKEKVRECESRTEFIP